MWIAYIQFNRTTKNIRVRWVIAVKPLEAALQCILTAFRKCAHICLWQRYILVVCLSNYLLWIGFRLRKVIDVTDTIMDLERRPVTRTKKAEESLQLIIGQISLNMSAPDMAERAAQEGRIFLHTFAYRNANHSPLCYVVRKMWQRINVALVERFCNTSPGDNAVAP